MRKEVEEGQKKMEKQENVVTKLEKEKQVSEGMVKNLKTKNKMKGVALMQQEKVVGDLEKKIKSFEILEGEMKNKEKEKDKIQGELEGMKKKLDDANKVIESNEQLIGYLNKQILERGVLNATSVVAAGSSAMAGMGGMGSVGGGIGGNDITSRLKSLMGVGVGGVSTGMPTLKTTMNTVQDYPVRSAGELGFEVSSPGSKMAGPVRFTPRVREQ